MAGLGRYGEHKVAEATEDITAREMVKADTVYQIMLNDLEGASILLKTFHVTGPEEAKRLAVSRMTSKTSSKERYKQIED